MAPVHGEVYGNEAGTINDVRKENVDSVPARTKAREIGSGISKDVIVSSCRISPEREVVSPVLVDQVLSAGVENPLSFLTVECERLGGSAA